MGLQFLVKATEVFVDNALRDGHLDGDASGQQALREKSEHFKLPVGNAVPGPRLVSVRAAEKLFLRRPAQPLQYLQMQVESRKLGLGEPQDLKLVRGERALGRDSQEPK
jgi:hypothetical protein